LAVFMQRMMIEDGHLDVLRYKECAFLCGVATVTYLVQVTNPYHRMDGMKLLHIDSSILGANSVSRKVAATTVAKLRDATPDLSFTYRDLTTAPLPHLTLAQLPGDHPLAALAPALSDDRTESDAVLKEFLAADIVVIGAPMYNFTIPSQLKAWIDRILVPGKTFRHGPSGVEGLAGGKRLIIAISRGGLYGAGAPFAAAEHVETYLRTAFGFIGITSPEIIIAEGLSLGAEQRQTALEEALQTATNLRAA
jgi:FMN-dependent NADH-azoreductase